MRLNIPLLRHRPRVVLAMADPAALEAALQALDGLRASYLIAPTTDALAAALRQGPARVVWHPSFQEGKIPSAHLDTVLQGAVSLEAFLADPEGVIRSGVPQRLTALPAGVYWIIGCAGGVGATTAALGLYHVLRQSGESVALLEMPARSRWARGLRLGEEGAVDIGGALAAGLSLPLARNNWYAVDGRTLAELVAKDPNIPHRIWQDLSEVYRLVVVDLAADWTDWATATKGWPVLLFDLRPEAVVAAEEISKRWPARRPLRALVARWGETYGEPHDVRLPPPPQSERWGRILSRQLLSHLVVGGGR